MKLTQHCKQNVLQYFFWKVQKEEDVIYIHNGILLSHKKEWNFVIYNNMDGPGECCAKIKIKEYLKFVTLPFLCSK